MADEIATPVVSEAPIGSVLPRRARRRRRLQIDPERVVQSVMRRADGMIQDRDRSLWMDKREELYAKFRGLLEPKEFPYEGAANTHLPIMMAGYLRQDAGLYNATMTTRPLISAKAIQSRNQERAERVTEVVDAQLFLEVPEAKRRIGDFISNFILDGNAVAYTPWVKRDELVRETKFAPPAPPDLPETDYLAQVLTALFPSATGISETSATGLDYRIQYLGDDGSALTASVNVYSTDGGALEIVLAYPATVFNGPVFMVLDIEDVLVRTRVANLQPPSEENPGGAPEVFLRTTYTIDNLRRQKKSGKLNWLGDEDIEKIINTARTGSSPSATPEETLKEQKDEAEGTEHREVEAVLDEEVGHLRVECLIAFDRWDVDGDGQMEDVFFLIARDAQVLMEARLLTDLWPAKVPYRPLAESVFVPVSNRWLGISMLELTEHLNDLIKGTLDLAIDAGKFANIPPFFYSASAAFRPGTIRYAPGEGYPVPGVARDAVYFPSIATRDQSWALNLVGLGYQFVERVLAISDAQYGRVPVGRASALRTMGTTLALLQQGDVRADQILLRLLNGLAQIAQNFHRMNRHLLPREKEYRIWGYEAPHRQAYRTITHRSEIDADMDFEFQASFLMSNPAMLAQSLQTLLTVIVSPLMIQMGLTDQQKIYMLVKDYIKALRQDPAKYLNAPSGTDKPPILAEEAISAILAGEVPDGIPLEGAQAHLEKLLAFQGSDAFGHLTSEQVPVFHHWMRQVGQAVMQERQMQAASQYQQALLQAGAAGGGGGPVGGIEAPEPGSGVANPQQAVNESLASAGA